MNILVLGGTRFFGIPMVKELLKQGHVRRQGCHFYLTQTLFCKNGSSYLYDETGYDY